MKKLKESSLQLGDIILTTSTEKASAAIRTVTGSDISHAMVYVQSHSVIDATMEGVQARNTQRLHYEDHLAVHVYRLRRDLTEKEAADICNYARAAIGTEYSLGEAARAGHKFTRGRSATRKQFCSRLAARAYDAAGIALVSNPDYCSPAELMRCPHLMEVADATETITDEEIAALAAGVDNTQRMRTATNALLAAARALDPGIQNIDDINKHLAAHPENDAVLCDALEKSGYLTLWQDEVNAHRWRYDLALMQEVPDKQAIEAYCRDTVADEPHGSQRFVTNRGGYVAFATTYPLRRYFKLMLKLYDALAHFHKQRVDVATQWLVDNGDPVPPAPPVLRPHTAEWSAALSKWDPKQAALARLAIETEGREDVCSICGDDPAEDYDLPTALHQPGGVHTLRLCEFCLKVRQSIGDPFEPLA